MGEARAKSRALKALVEREPRCVYCEDLPTQIEHMPPPEPFSGTKRGLTAWNSPAARRVTKARAARILLPPMSPAWRAAARLATGKTLENKARHSVLERYAPGFLNELFRRIGRCGAPWIAR